MGLFRKIVKEVVAAPVTIPADLLKGASDGAKEAGDAASEVADWLFEGKRPR